MKKEHSLPVFFIGLAWALIGLGYQAIVIRYVPQGAALVAEALGLFLAGSLTGALFLRAVATMKGPMGRGLVIFGYLLFSPVGMMAGLVAPGSLEPVNGGSWLAFFLGAPVVISVTASVAVLIGLGFTGGLAVAVQRIDLGRMA